MNDKITYPIDLKCFAKFQQSGVSWELGEKELELVKVVADAANQAYAAGKNGKDQPFDTDLRNIIQFYKRCGKTEDLENHAVIRAIKCFCFWVNDAYKAGQAAAELGAIGGVLT